MTDARKLSSMYFIFSVNEITNSLILTTNREHLKMNLLLIAGLAALDIGAADALAERWVIPDGAFPPGFRKPLGSLLTYNMQHSSNCNTNIVALEKMNLKNLKGEFHYTFFLLI